MFNVHPPKIFLNLLDIVQKSLNLDEKSWEGLRIFNCTGSFRAMTYPQKWFLGGPPARWTGVITNLFKGYTMIWGCHLRANASSGPAFQKFYTNPDLDPRNP